MIHRHVVSDLLIFQSMLRGNERVEPLEEDYPFSERDLFDRETYPRLFFVEKNYSGDPTNWWIPNRACAEAMLRSAGFRIESNLEEEAYLCRRVEQESALPLSL